MQCLHPITVKNKVTGRYFNVPCRKCPCCLHNRQKEWAFRLMAEARYSDSPSYFITLTFDDLLVPDVSLVTDLDKVFLHKFMKRLSRRLQYHSIMDEVRYFACGEYGDLGRAHYHFLLFNCPLSASDLRVLIEDVWSLGFVTVAPISDARCMYVAKYTCKELFDDPFYSSKKEKPFASISTGRKKGHWLGYKFLEDHQSIKRIKDEQLFFVRSSNGSVYNLPRAYRDKIFTPYEKELHSDFLSFRAERPALSYESGLRRILSKINSDNYYESQFFKRLSDDRKRVLSGLEF